VDNVFTTDQKGNIAEAAIVYAAVKLGIDVYRPVGEGGRYDMIFEVGSQLLRVQCKWAPRHRDVVVIRCYSARRNRHGLIRRKYLDGEIDAFAAYCPDTDRCYFLPFQSFLNRTQIQLRLGPCKNNQKLGINWAKDYDFAATLGPHGAIAQLGERVSGRDEVAGSSPAGSTSKIGRPGLSGLHLPQTQERIF
jgi:PD-(D/E)XK endonuclease